MNINLPALSKPIHQFMQQHASSILTGLSVAGVGATAVLAGKASVKAHELIYKTESNKLYDPDTQTPEALALTTQEKLKLIWPEFIPVAIVAGATVVSIVMINRVSAREAATMAAAYKLSEDKLKAYRAKVEEKLGVEKAEDIHNEVVEERLARSTNEVMMANADDVLFLDVLTGRYFMSNLLAVHKAENTINHEIMTHGFASLGMYYAEIELPQPDISEDLGWNSDNLVEIDVGTTKTPDHRPCFTLTFLTPPKPNYGGNDIG